MLFNSIRLVALMLVVLITTPSSHAQSSTSSSASGANSTTAANIITTTILTSIPASGTNSATVTSTVVTTTLNSTVPTANATSSSLPPGATPTTIIFPDGSNSTAVIFANGTTTFSNGTSLFPNGTAIAANGTVVMGEIAEPYNGTLALGLPFAVKLDPAYGVAGGVLIVSGAFVGLFGGKNRWSSLAIVSGYAMLLFTLVMILSFGVKPSLAPPSPHPPSATTRGLYCLACIISGIIGSAIGIFFWKYAKFFVCGVGGFALGWYVIALQTGGVVSGNIIARWGIIGGLFVAFFIAGLVPQIHFPLVILTTSWIGATALTLGIDCFARTGLKEFYIYNLGYHSLFPALNGYPYPLLVNMQILLGVLGACFLIAAAIQFRVLGVLQNKLKQIHEEDIERRQVKDSDKAAERFSALGKDLEKWESKYGSSGGSRSPIDSGEAGQTVPMLSKDGRTSSAFTIPAPDITTQRDGQTYAEIPLDSPRSTEHVRFRESTETKSLGGQSIGMLPPMQLGDSLTPSLGVAKANSEPEKTSTARYPETTADDINSNLRLLDEIQAVRSNIDALRHSSLSSRSGSPAAAASSHLPIGSGSSGSDAPRHRLSQSGALTPSPSGERAEWQEYLQSRQLYTPPAGITPPIASPPALSSPAARAGRLSRISPSVVDAVTRRDRTMSAFELGSQAQTRHDLLTPNRTVDGEVRPRRYSAMDALDDVVEELPLRDRRQSYRKPDIVGHAESPAPASGTRAEVPRTATFEELAARHKAKISKLQQPITDKMTSEIQLAETKQRYDAQREADRRVMATKEQRRSQMISSPPRNSPDLESTKRAGTQGKPHSDLRTIPVENPITKAAQWRRSVAVKTSDPKDQERDNGQELPARRPVDNRRRSTTELGSSRRTSRGPNQLIN